MISLSSLLQAHAYLAGDGTDEQHVALAREQLDAAVPVLIEIARTALAWSESDGDDVLIERMLMDVVSKVVQ